MLSFFDNFLHFRETTAISEPGIDVMVLKIIIVCCSNYSYLSRKFLHRVGFEEMCHFLQKIDAVVENSDHNIDPCNHFQPKMFGPFAMCLQARVARWFVFKPKIPNLGKFWRDFER
jgi:hypothetical protein